VEAAEVEAALQAAVAMVVVVMVAARPAEATRAVVKLVEGVVEVAPLVGVALAEEAPVAVATVVVGMVAVQKAEEVTAMGRQAVV
jgi:hypothetical protein